MELNKNISVWRGNETPPTQYHLWVKENGSLFLKIAGEWTCLVSEEDRDIDDYISNLKNKDLLLSEITVTPKSRELTVTFKSLDTDDFLERTVYFDIPEATNTQLGLIRKSDIGSGIIKIQVNDTINNLTTLNGSKDSILKFESETLDLNTDSLLDGITIKAEIQSIAPETLDVFYTNLGIGDICMYDKEMENYFFISVDKINLDKYPLSRFEPIGIKVIPNEHDVYGNGESGVISIKYLDENNDEGSLTGTEHYHGIVKGKEYSIVRSKFPTIYYDYVFSKEYKSFDKILSTYDSDNFSVINKWDTKTRMRQQERYLPSPYDNEYFSDINLEFFRPTYDYYGGKDLFNPLGLFCGKYIKNECLSLKDKYGIEETTLVELSDSFHTLGTKSGDWFLPSIGELCYLISRKNIIDGAFKALKNIYPDKVCALSPSQDIKLFPITCSTLIKSISGDENWNEHKVIGDYTNINKKKISLAFINLP